MTQEPAAIRCPDPLQDPLRSQDRQACGSRVAGWAFAGYLLDERGQCLHRHGRMQHLSRKEFHLLLALARAQGDIVDRSRLMDLLWSGEAVSEAALTKIVQKVRERLEAPGEDVIRTVYKAGYQLMPPARRLGEAPAASDDDLLSVGISLRRIAEHVDALPLPVLRSTLQIAVVCCRRGQHAEMKAVFAAAAARLGESHGHQFALSQLAEFYLAECKLQAGQADDAAIRAVARLRPEALDHAEPDADWASRLTRLKERLASTPRPERRRSANPVRALQA